MKPQPMLDLKMIKKSNWISRIKSPFFSTLLGWKKKYSSSTQKGNVKLINCMSLRDSNKIPLRNLNRNRNGCLLHQTLSTVHYLSSITQIFQAVNHKELGLFSPFQITRRNFDVFVNLSVFFVVGNVLLFFILELFKVYLDSSKSLQGLN